MTVSVRRHEKQEPGHNAGRWARAWVRVWRKPDAKKAPYIHEAVGLVIRAGKGTFFGTWAGFVFLTHGRNFGCPVPWCTPDSTNWSMRHVWTALAVGLVWANLAVLWQTMKRR